MAAQVHLKPSHPKIERTLQLDESVSLIIAQLEATLSMLHAHRTKSLGLQRDTDTPVRTTDLLQSSFRSRRSVNRRLNAAVTMRDDAHDSDIAFAVC